MAQEIADSKLLDTWGSSGTKIEPDISKIIEGWQLGEQPPHEYMNWLQNTFGSKLNHILKNGIAKWNDETPYLEGSSVQHNGNVWLCKIINTNSEPTRLNANWEKVAISKDLTVTVDTLANLKSISYPANTVWVSGYHTKNDGAFGSHIFRLKGVKTTETDNGGTVIIATIGGVDYVYELQYDGAINVKWFGAKGDGVTDDTVAIQNAVNYIMSIHPISSPFYNNRRITNLLFKDGEFLINGNILFSSGIKFIGDNGTITSSKTTFEPLFSSAYIEDGELIPLSTITDSTLLTSKTISDIAFENINFKNIPFVLDITAVIWQSYVKNCSFYYCGRAIDAHFSFYMDYESVFTYGKKYGYDEYSMIRLSSFVNSVKLENVSIARFGTSENESTGVGIEILPSSFSNPSQNSGGGFQNISINNCSFEGGKEAIKITGEGHGLSIQNTYIEELGTFIKDTDGDIKTGISINLEASWKVKTLINLSGLRNSTIYPHANKDDGTPGLNGKIILYSGTNGNNGTVVYRDTRWAYDSAKYALSPEVITYDYSGGAVGIGTSGNKNWNPNSKATQIGTSGALYSAADNLHVLCNAYRDTSDIERRILSGKATRYIQEQGLHLFYSSNTTDNADTQITDMNEIIRFSPNSVLPGADNNKTLGNASLRWSVVYAGTGTINTSDDREKTYLTIEDKETSVAKELKGLMKKFKFNDAIEAKGEDKARIHFGTSAQEVISTFEKHGLDAMQYAIVCYDEWDAEYEQILDKESILDEDGKIIEEATYRNGSLIKEAGNRYGIRYEELLCFIMSAL